MSLIEELDMQIGLGHWVWWWLAALVVAGLVVAAAWVAHGQE